MEEYSYAKVEGEIGSEKKSLKMYFMVNLLTTKWLFFRYNCQMLILR